MNKSKCHNLDIKKKKENHKLLAALYVWKGSLLAELAGEKHLVQGKSERGGSRGH